MQTLHEDRLFRCHKTIQYELEESDGHIPLTEKDQHCAGALVYMQKCGKDNAPMQIGERLRMFDPSQLRGHDDVIEPLEISKFKVRFGDNLSNHK
ncbi:hypothetical protein GZH47_33130 (plasmid) [Paenibacillus rhizovicinus]|uniref:Uncharacterized protein n=1 Tax=Paenibacillus rhizovicinus TaxID=2704463 RepID=A0A6C0PB44_9BACL|nr:hypothetical protein [Paenibacillus rhizovicinus]QHW35738.1 hypothetical protein GZH47_33130 [Paenibacillus rhizovicinus]